MMIRSATKREPDDASKQTNKLVASDKIAAYQATNEHTNGKRARGSRESSFTLATSTMDVLSAQSIIAQ